MTAETAPRRTDTASLLIPAPPAALYRAFADAAALMAWLPPAGMSGRALEYDFRPGGVYAIELTYDDGTHAGIGKSSARRDVSRGRFVALDPDARIVQRVVFDTEDPAFTGTMTLTWTFAPEDGATRVTVTALDVPPGISAADHAAGLGASLENLRRFVAER